MTDTLAEAIELVPEQARTPAYDADGQVRDGTWVTEITDLLDVSTWPKGCESSFGRKAVSGSSVAVHRPRRPAPDRVRHQHSW